MAGSAAESAAKDRRAGIMKEHAGEAAARGASTKMRGLGRMRKMELCPFTQKLAAMLDAGLPLVQCMEALSEQTSNPDFQKVVKAIGERIEGGDSFAEALERFHELFGDLFISMIRAGEMGGSLAEVTQRLAVYMESSQKMIRKVKSAMTYPVIVMCLAGILTAAMLLFIVPIFANIFADFGAKLPAPTQFLVEVSKILRSYAPFVLAGGGVLVWLFRRFKSTERGAFLCDQYMLRLPVAGPLLEKVAMGRLARTFASMIRSGVNILKSLEIVSAACGNKYIGKAIMDASRKIEGGSGIASAFKESGQFPPMIIHMISAGEKTGNVDGMLEKVADFYEDEVANLLESLSSMIEPLLMAFLGVVIGGIVICMFLPIFKMNEIVQN